MSAFIVSPNCINAIVTYVHARSIRFRWLRERLNLDVSAPEDAWQLATALCRLNCEAIEQRYGAERLKEDMTEGEKFPFQMVTRSPIEVFKAACCLLYQCSEGTVPEQDLFKVLDEIAGQIAQQIVRALPDYDAAAWGD